MRLLPNDSVAMGVASSSLPSFPMPKSEKKSSLGERPREAGEDEVVDAVEAPEGEGWAAEDAAADAMEDDEDSAADVDADE